MFTIYSFSQNAKIDSLKNELKNANNQALKIKLLDELSWEYKYIDPVKSLEFAKKQLIISNEIDLDSCQAKSYINIGNAYLLKSQYKESISNYKKSLSLYITSNDNKGKATAYTNLGNAYFRQGDYENALNYTYISLKKEKQNNNKKGILKSLGNLGLIYKNLKKYDEALKCYFEILKSIENQNFDYVATLVNIGILYKNKNDYTNAFLFIKKADDLAQKKNDNFLKLLTKLNLGDLYFTEGSFIKATSIFENLTKDVEKLGDKLYITDFYIKLGYSKFKSHNLISNIDLIKKGLKIANKENIKENSKNGNLYLSEAFKSLNQLDSAYYYYKKYSELDKEIINIEKLKIIENLKEKYQTTEKEAKIKTQQLQIQKEKANKNIALTGIAFILLLGFGGFWLYRNKQNQTNLKTQNTLLSLQQNLMEAELSNLNKQLDPHEIKNLLASISPEIQEKAPESYKKMLKLFNLTKASLNSNSITDSLENQLQQIDDFLSLERNMLPIPLDYTIENSIQNTQTQIPRLLLKNLVENAIKHGIKQQETGGSIIVKIEEMNNYIYISVDDTGKGRNLAISLDSGIGTTTYQKLFATLNPKNKENAAFEIIDKEQGTKVEVKIPTNYKYS